MAQVILEIPDNKLSFIMEMLQYFSFVKAKIKGAEPEHLKEFKEAVEEVKLAKQGKIKLQSAKDLLNEL